MNFHISKLIDSNNIELISSKVGELLKDEGFGILNTINMAKTLKEKIDVDFKPYIILGACNPKLAYKALSIEDKIGVFLPCNIVIQLQNNNTIEVSAINPISAMQSLENKELKEFAIEVNKKLSRVINNL